MTPKQINAQPISHTRFCPAPLCIVTNVPVPFAKSGLCGSLPVFPLPFGKAPSIFPEPSAEPSPFTAPLSSVVPDISGGVIPSLDPSGFSGGIVPPSDLSDRFASSPELSFCLAGIFSPPLPPPFITPIAVRFTSDASMRLLSSLRCSSAVEGIVPSSCPAID